MAYLIDRESLKESLINKLVEDVRNKSYSFFSDTMNSVFIEQIDIIKEDLFFVLIDKECVFKDSNDLYSLENNELYEDAYQFILKQVIKEFKRVNKEKGKDNLEDLDLNICLFE